MIKRTFDLTKDQLDWIKSEAARLQISLGEVLRRIIDKARGA